MKDVSKTVVVAMSGGLDSAMAVALLKRDGWKVSGLHFALPASAPIREERKEAVKRIAKHLNISLEQLDLREEFTSRIIDPFLDAYLKGFTPNPCVRCNAQIKFRHLMRYAEEKGLSFCATGHYARLEKEKDSGVVRLLRGKDRRKEQSYFLHRLDRAFLSKAVFPLGEMEKEEVRHQAIEMGLPVHSSPESQEICFIPENDYRSFVEKLGGPGVKRTGSILHVDGHKLGEHGGAYRYTIGQRQGLGIASSRPYYVKEIRPEANEVVVARKEALYSKRVEAAGFYWMEGVPQERTIRAEAQIRYRHRAAPGRLEAISPDKIVFEFDEPQWAVTPGQALVCYEGDRVLGGGWIKRNGEVLQDHNTGMPGEPV